ncbi:hypothetical protein [Parageobacillus thermoglucosidasius]|uniref:Uncharacterized protein n=2 Tax=Anoxybacillaceae TaxID=3120669 RepID=A0AAN0YS90_PARTM|nr:hypothetical protein [Parageobacillus thermoglucosidasius]ALF08558.1 hypothetical protein AOT13_00020 [Parageobacillus thermoglucosidasius]ALF11945.1 hypothetical protein AOT13_19035 [Parageobacillus thermoglucosidasius]ANZ28641.1 hypothetical protein BCV53_00025 [Parageobacillus thermoglucosidasius]ANZ32029.1 hypothetical protein BCV53_19100 [Parageobacillus thermoglucosidasius]APM79378.1 hypothetical protein BCV54_00030 [Parageobacillus thermoglucosidasius]
MNVMPIRLFTIQDGEGFVADAFQCPVTGNLIYKSSGTPSVIAYNALTEEQIQYLEKYGFRRMNGASAAAASSPGSSTLEELLPEQ